MMDNIELIVINKWKKWGKNEFVYLWVTGVVRFDYITRCSLVGGICVLFFFRFLNQLLRD